MTEAFLLISIGSRRRLVRLSEVQEILSLMALTPVDGASGSCRGLANLRGQTVPIFDTAGARAVLSPSRFILMVQVEGAPIGLIVDEVHDVISIEQGRIKRQPIGPGRTTEVVTLGSEILTVLEPERAASAEIA